ncbi:TnsD family Tn7-like transposition protein [Clostridium pasteurianum]|uniref:TnsD family Tn7-like transposition protein n=1 Tax=Clostridium pasteurianum TaxID=1501 RepID=UPI0022609ADE|nr:TnsD family Tn7-like transposition protein [Clostridium pasteurianum]UZW12829.1 TnsD family Tn7-like transposition protein [Clostridium pasteurianum]
MVTFFPMPYPGETLYSMIARYHIWSGNLNSKATLRDLFNTTSITAGRELPANINLLLNNLPKNCTLTVDEIIKNHTLYKYYTAFLPSERAKYVYDLMEGGNGSLIFTSLGMCNNNVKIDSSLKYCSFCVEIDRAKYGEAYYHIEHQVPGVLMCHQHLSELKVCNKSIDLKNRQEYLNLELRISDDDTILASLNEKIIEHQKIFCNNIDSIINGNFKFKEMNFFREHYLKKLIDKGMAKSRMKIYQQDLLRNFKSYYGDDYLTLLGCNFDVDNKFNWVTTITRKHRKSFHPIQHLLMIEYLNIDIEALFNSDYIEVKKGKTYIDKTDEEKAVYRGKWIELSKMYSNNSKSFIKDLDVATYAWLNRHDKKWLNENSPLKKTYGHSKKIDWAKRDEEILQEVKEVVEGIYNSIEKPERVTVGGVGRKIEKAYLLQKYIGKMPKTKEYLQEKCESVEEFQKRRVDWVREKVMNKGESEWIVRRKAGIK